LAIKDTLTTKGIRTTCASKILENFIPPYTATSVAKLSSLGIVNLGKTNMDEFAMGSSNENSAFGSVKNPWNKDCVPGGSSGGSAAAVAGRLAPAALGTDTGGSVRQPASFCNLVGVKPTYGRVSRYGLIAYASSLDSVGVFSSKVIDSATILEAMAGKDPLDATSVEVPVPNFTATINNGIKGLRIGVPDEYFIAGINPEVEKLVRTAIAQLEELGAKIVRISLPSTKLAVAAYYIVAGAEASSNLARFDGIRYGHRANNASDLVDVYKKSRSEGFGEEVQRRILIGAYVLSTGYYDAYYIHAQKIRSLIANEFKEAFTTKCDLIACPTAPTTAFKLNEKIDDPVSMYLNDVFTIPVNMAGLPGISIPCGFDSKNLPVGLQLIGKAWDEETLFRVAQSYESSSEWHKRVPNSF
jgi:aspartyl-tRNA(Asn)/glutamyl-tRNA(Gln) amidotransferase subunit A